jgi:hypothetical protein
MPPHGHRHYEGGHSHPAYASQYGDQQQQQQFQSNQHGYPQQGHPQQGHPQQRHPQQGAQNLKAQSSATAAMHELKTTRAFPNDQCQFLFKFIVVGDSQVGKTCLLLQFTDNR